MFLTSWPFICAVMFVFLASGCSNSSSNKNRYYKSPVDKLIVELSNVDNYSIILNDMDYQNGDYLHEYKIVEQKANPDTIVSRIIPMQKVSDAFFQKHIDNLGMEIVSKKDGKLNKVAGPPGYNSYVGNPQYGHWVNRSNGSSFWEFYGKYAMLRTIFNMGSYPVYHSYYNDYERHRRDSRPYYGTTSNGGKYYGTGGHYSNGQKNSTWNSKSSSFKSRVRDKVSRSAQSSKRSSRVNRSSSRYKNSSMRSRGGSYGK